MTKKIFSCLAGLAIFGTVAVSCTKDKPLTNDKNEVLTATGEPYAVDTLNSKIEWKGYKIFKSESTSHFGTIKFESGTVSVKDGKLASGTFVADMGSLTSVDLKDAAEQLNKLNSHLKSADFFGVEKFPTASFEITKIEENTTGDYNSVLEGNLTIKGITKVVKFNANVNVDGENVTIATEPTDINREDFGVKFQAPVENGVIQKEITLQANIKANAKK